MTSGLRYICPNSNRLFMAVQRFSLEKKGKHFRVELSGRKEAIVCEYQPAQRQAGPYHTYCLQRILVHSPYPLVVVGKKYVRVFFFVKI